MQRRSVVFVVLDCPPSSLPRQAAAAAFGDYAMQPSNVCVPALRRSFTVNLGQGSEGRFRLGAGWKAVAAAARPELGDLMRLTMTAERSFRLETAAEAPSTVASRESAAAQGACVAQHRVPSAAPAALQEERRSRPKPAPAARRRRCPLHRLSATIRPHNWLDTHVICADPDS